MTESTDFEKRLAEVADLYTYLMNKLKTTDISMTGLPDDWKACVTKLMGDKTETGHIQTVYLHGFDSIQKSTEQPQGTADRHAQSWVQETGNRGKSLRFLQVLQTVFVAAYLERFMKEVSALLATSPTATITSTWQKERKESESLAHFLSRWLTPTAKKGGRTWLRRVKMVVGQQCDDAVGQAIVVLLQWRHTFVHRVEELDSVVTKVRGETLASWQAAVQLFGLWIAQAAHKSLQSAGPVSGTAITGVTLQMKKVKYSSDLWHMRKPDPTLRDFFIGKDRLIEIVHGEPPYDVVVGVPHQAAVGDKRICGKRKVHGQIKDRDSDENAALYALAAFASLCERNRPCKLVVAVHSTDHDPNKIKGSPYWDDIFSEDTYLLLECHGSGPHAPYAVEVTAGRNKLADPERFGRLVSEAIGHQYSLAAQTQPGQDDAVAFLEDGTERRDGKLRYAALGTLSLAEAEKRMIPAVHVEAKPEFRIPDDGSNTLTEDGQRLGRAIAKAIIAYNNA